MQGLRHDESWCQTSTRFMLQQTFVKSIFTLTLTPNQPVLNRWLVWTSNHQLNPNLSGGDVDGQHSDKLAYNPRNMLKLKLLRVQSLNSYMLAIPIRLTSPSIYF